MKSRFLLVFVLIFSLLSPLSVLAQDPQGSQKPTTQTIGEPPPPPMVAKPTQEGQVSPTPDTSAKAKKPLSTNEDPSMIGKRNINKGLIKGGSLEKEVALGRQIAAEVDRQAKFVTDDPECAKPGSNRVCLNEYVNRVGQNIALHSDIKIAVIIKIIDSDEINAFALPGGFVYVNRGVIVAASSEAEMASVIAHELGHVAARHGMENKKKGDLISTAANIGLMVLGGGVAGAVAQNTGGLGLAVLFMKFSRGAEEEADSLGVQYLYAAGYDPGAMATMFEKLEAKKKKQPNTLQKIFSDHPAPAARRQKVIELAARFPEREEYVINSSEFQNLHAKMVQLTSLPVATTTDPNDPNGSRAPVRPTLKRRPQTDPNDQASPDEPAPSENRTPPTMKKRTDPPPDKP